MNKDELRKRKISEKYVLSPGYFLIAICGVRDKYGRIPNEAKLNRLNHNEVVYLASLLGSKPSMHQVTLERVCCGDIILVRYRGGDIRAYMKPTKLTDDVVEPPKRTSTRMQVNQSLAKRLLTDQIRVEDSKVRKLGTLNP